MKLIKFYKIVSIYNNITEVFEPNDKDFIQNDFGIKTLQMMKLISQHVPSECFDMDPIKTAEILSENNFITHIKGVNVIDYMIKYENLQQDISLLEKKINAPGLYQTFKRMNAKGNIRPHNTNVNTMFTEELKDYVQKKARL